MNNCQRNVTRNLNFITTYTSSNTHFMTRRTTYILAILTSACGLFATRQQSNREGLNKFTLILTTYNHAERLFKGITTFELADHSLKVRRRHMFSDKDTLLFFKKLDNNSIARIKNIRLDSLQDFYFNYCIVATSGNEYFVLTTKDTMAKEISLHHYYNPQIESLINELNKHVPSNLKHNYLEKDTKQDCEQ